MLARPPKSKFGILGRVCVLGASIVIIIGMLTGDALAVSAGLAKRCGALTAKAFPPREVGNPADSARGTGRLEQDYFSKCLANGRQHR
jgi:hypothetical protein